MPLDGNPKWAWSRASRTPSARAFVARDPEHLTQEFSKADRGGRILVDTGRNGYSATFAAAYTVRAKPGAPVSAPCTWEEIERGEVGPRTFTLRTMPERIAAVGNLWADFGKSEVGSLKPEVQNRLEELTSEVSRSVRVQPDRDGSA